MYLIIDGSSMLSTNYYGTLPKEIVFAKTDEEKERYYPKIMHAEDGTYTNGIYMSLKQLFSIMKEQKPEGLAVVFDVSRNTFRKQMFSDYKGNRSSTPHPLKSQFILFEKILEDIGVKVFYSSEYEADDYAGSIKTVLENQGKSCVVMSADKDYYQLVSPCTRMWRIIPSPARDKYERHYNMDFEEYTKTMGLPSNVFEITQDTGIICDDVVGYINPEDFVTYLALEGDKVDGIPGVKGLGVKSIIPLVQEYHSLDGIYSQIDACGDAKEVKELADFWKSALGLKKSPVNVLLKEKENAELSFQLAQIKTDIPVDTEPENYRVNIDRKKLDEYVEKLGLKSLIGKY